MCYLFTVKSSSIIGNDRKRCEIDMVTTDRWYRKWYKWPIEERHFQWPPSDLQGYLVCCKPFKCNFLTPTCAAINHCRWRAICLRQRSFLLSSKSPRLSKQCLKFTLSVHGLVTWPLTFDLSPQKCLPAVSITKNTATEFELSKTSYWVTSRTWCSAYSGPLRDDL